MAIFKCKVAQNVFLVSHYACLTMPRKIRCKYLIGQRAIESHDKENIMDAAIFIGYLFVPLFFPSCVSGCEGMMPIEDMRMEKLKQLTWVILAHYIVLNVQIILKSKILKQ